LADLRTSNAVRVARYVFAPSVTRRLVEALAPRGGERGSGPPTSDLGALTTRAVEVPRLIAGGLSNADIADRLYISEATVKTDLNRTMAKRG
jgi:DNA-binding NarL/FixJ family response regulator